MFYKSIREKSRKIGLRRRFLAVGVIACVCTCMLVFSSCQKDDELVPVQGVGKDVAPNSTEKSYSEGFSMIPSVDTSVSVIGQIPTLITLLVAVRGLGHLI